MILYLSLFFVLISLIFGDASIDSHSRDRMNASRREYFKGSAISFLQKYGKYFNLFDIFFPDKSKNIIYPSQSQDWNINGIEYKTRRYKNYMEWSHSSCNPTMFYNDAHYYTAQFKILNIPSHTDILFATQYNNRFRFGKNECDRYFSIFLNNDPYEDNATTINFVGLAVRLDNKNYDYYCRFVYPVSYDSIILSSNVVDPITRCRIPPLESIKNKSKFIFHFMKKLKINDNNNNNNKEEITLLKNVQVPRLHSMDRRKFKVTMYTMIESINDVLILEWLIYNIMLGVEHFYLFDNRKIFSHEKLDLKTSIIKPFIDANIITLVYFPYFMYGPNHWAPIQRTTFHVMLQQFGNYNHWVGFNDIDEFFLPSKYFQLNNLTSIIKYYNQMNNNNSSNNQNYDNNMENNIIYKILEYANGNGYYYPKRPNGGILLDSIEMECEDKSNYFLSSALNRTAQTISCNTMGLSFFKENTSNHGKMFVNTKKSRFVESPHWVSFGVPANREMTGIYRHFNRLKYTKQFGPIRTHDNSRRNDDIHHISRKELETKSLPQSHISYPGDHNIRDFTYKLLKEIIGVYYEA
eukprot:gene8915-12023_t